MKNSSPPMIKNSKFKIQNSKIWKVFREIMIIGIFIFPVETNALKDFQDLYKRIYEKTNSMTQEHEESVCKRVQNRKANWDNPDTLEEDTFKNISCPKLQTLERWEQSHEGEKKLEEIEQIHWSIQSQQEWAARAKDVMKFERELLWFEDYLKERLNHMSIHSDRKMGKADDQYPYDLIDDLDEIDELIFGEKAYKKDQPKPEFVYEKSKKYRSRIGEDEGEEDTENKDEERDEEEDIETGDWPTWMDGFKEKFPCYKGNCNTESQLTTNPNDYSEEDGFIAGNFANMKNVLEYKLADLSQVAECNNTRLFQQSGWYYLPDIGDLYSQKILKAPIQKADLEVEINNRELIGKRFAGLEDRIRLETSCLNRLEEARKGKYNLTKKYSDELMEECTIMRTEDWEQHLDAIKKAATMEPEQQYFVRILRVIDYWNDDFFAWYDQVVKLKKIFKDLAHKPKKL